jgi:hypothetical protein
MKHDTRLFPGLVLLCLFTQVMSGGASAATIHVPAQIPTIQEALDRAAAGDTVLVAPGTYVENILWPPVDGIHLLGSGAEVTTIDGDRVASVIRFETANTITSATLIQGFTITNGFARPPWPYSQGGGIYLFYADPTLRELWLVENEADDFGGGIYSWWSDPTLVRVLIARNVAISRGGFDCFHGTPHLDHVTVVDNDPGGLYFDTRTVPLLENSIVAFNDSYNVEVQGTYIEPTQIDRAYTDIYGGLLLVGVAQVNDLGGNIDENPRFVDFVAGDYELQADSPCIDAADPGYPPDPDGTRSDMGAFPYDQSSAAVEPIAAGVGRRLRLAAGPNPFAHGTTFSYTLPQPAAVTLTVLDPAGRAVRTLVDRAMQGPGAWAVHWDGRDASGRVLPSGLYLYRIEAAGLTEIRVVVAVR